MTNHYILGLALAVPALVQAQESNVEQIFDEAISISEAFAGAVIAVAAQEISPQEAVDTVKKLQERVRLVKASVKALSADELTALQGLMSQEERAAALAPITEAAEASEKVLEEKNYFDTPALKAAIEAFKAS